MDQAALPPPEQETSAVVAPPSGATQERLAGLWQLLLPADRASGDLISRDDSFFALGGNSLLAARLMFRVREEFDVELRMAAFYEEPTLAACARAIDAARSQAAPPAGAGVVPATRPASAGIGRRDRSAYRVAAAKAAPDQAAELAPHLVRLTDDWALWRTFCLRAPGFPIRLLAALGDADLASAADDLLAAGGTADSSAAQAAFAAEFAAATGRLSAALYHAACLPELREAVAWQNRHALSTGIDVLVRRGVVPAKRNAKHRLHEALISSYLQRYCAKNDTIGFFGPMCWSELDDGVGIRISHDPAGRSLVGRTTYLEGWAVRAVLADYATALRPWLVPRRMPFVGLDGSRLRLPLAPPMRLSPAEAAVLRACDGRRHALDVAAEVLADPTAGLGTVDEVFALLDRLADSHRLAWRADIAPQDTRPERSIRTLLATVSDDSLREPIEQALDQLTEAKDDLARAAGDAQGVADAMASLEATFTGLAGAAPTRRAGENYAGRTLAYEECLRGESVRVGPDALDGIRDALALVLDSARWYTTTVGSLYARHFDEVYRQRAAELGTDVVPFADFWLMVNDDLFGQPPPLLAGAVAELRRRWAAVLELPPDARQVRFSSAELRERVAAQFPAQQLPWPVAVHHSPDLMIAGADAAAGGRVTWVLGEVHPSVVTMRYATWLEFHPAPDSVRAAMRQDTHGAAVWFAETAENGGTCSRLSNVLPLPGDRRLVYAHDSCGYAAGQTVPVGECDLISTPTGLRVRHRDGSYEASLLAVVGDLVSTVISNRFDLVVPGAHTPRVTVDDLVVSREKWTFAGTEPGFANTADESTRYLQARAWAASHGLPRHVFLRFTGELKPIYADLTSLASVDLIARSLRRAQRNAGPDASVAVVEMLPAPDEAWLVDAQGGRYTSELRMVAVDQKAAYQKQEG